jgi:hypothetical protein
MTWRPGIPAPKFAQGFVMKALEEFVATSDAAIGLYAGCWDDILRLPIEPLTTVSLFEEVKQIVRVCRGRTGDHSIGWLREQVEDGRRLVAEELDNDPDRIEWQRIDAALAGAVTGLADDLRLYAGVGEPKVLPTAAVLAVAAFAAAFEVKAIA